MPLIHFPLELGWGPYKISAHLVFETLAFIIGFRYFLSLRKQQSDPVSESNRIWIIIGATFGALIFSRLVGALENPILFLTSEHPWLYLYANKTIVGGLLGGLIGVEMTKKLIGEKASSGDLFTYPLILAMMIGRVGCFFNGVYEATYGDITTFAAGMDLGDGMKRHPVAIYEIVFLAYLWWNLRLVEKRVMLQNGYRFQLFMIAYLSFRFFLDFIKPGFHFPNSLTTIQNVCVFGLVYYRSTLWKIFFKPTALFVNE